MNLVPHLLLALLGLVASSDAVAMTWHWSNPDPHGNNIIDLATQDGLFVEACDTGQLYISYDGLTWLARDSHTTNDLQSIALFGSRVLVTGANGSALYSDDGQTFVYTNLQTTDWLVGVAASPSLAVAVGDNAAIYTSRDGASWKRQAAPPGVGTSWLLSVGYGNGAFVAVGENGYIATSPNGTNWTHRSPVLVPALTNNLTRVTWIDIPGATNGPLANAFWITGEGGRVVCSTNLGTNWFNVTGLAGTNDFFTITANDTSRLVAGETDARLGTLATNTLSWNRQLAPLSSSPLPAPAWTYYGACWDTNNSLYWLAGQTGMLVEGSLTNGVGNWTTPYTSPRDWLWGVTSVQELYVAVGDHARILTSDNGLDWSIEALANTNSVSASNTVFFGVGGDTNLLVAVGNKGSIAVSPNNAFRVVTTNTDGTLSTNDIGSQGVGWYPMIAPTTNDLHGVCVFSNRYYAVGGNGTILSSPTGTNWAAATSGTTAYLSALEVFSNTLVIVGDAGTVLTSPNGATWTRRTTSTTNWLYRVRAINNRLIAVGENGTILTSSNAITWTAQTNGVNTKAWLNDVLQVTNTTYVVGTLGTVLTSTNLTNWATVGTLTTKSLYGLATQDGQLITVGIEGVILRSQLIPDLTPVNFLTYDRADGLELFLVGGQPDQKFTLDSSVTLTNWTTGPQMEITDSSGTLGFYLNTGTNAPSPMFYRTKLVMP